MFELQTEDVQGQPRCKVAFVTKPRSFPQLDIVQQEYIHESGLQQFEVVNAVFDASGNWLATVEERKQKTTELELNLKLWAFDEQTQRCACLQLHVTHGRYLSLLQPCDLLTVSPAVLC